MTGSINRDNAVIPLLIQAKTVMLETRLRRLAKESAGVDWYRRILGAVDLIADDANTIGSRFPRTG